MPQTLLRDGLAQLITGRFAAQQELPVNPSFLTRWRQRLGESGMESLLSATVEAAIESKAVKARDRKRRVRTTDTAKRLMDDIKSGLIEVR